MARLFLKLGFTAFGGPAAHIALMEDEVVHRRKWIDRQHFLDLVSAINFIPGPNSTELAIHLGFIRAGWRGLFIAGICFIAPAALIILGLGYFYVQYGSRPQAIGPLAAIRGAMIAIIAAALWRFARTGVKDGFTGAIALLATVAGFVFSTDRVRIPQYELILLACAAIAGTVWYRRSASSPQSVTAPKPVPPVAVAAPVMLLGVSSVGGKMGLLTLFFLKVGATLFGSGYVLVNYLHAGLVQGHGWLSADKLADAVAVGQVTPGPLLTTATFIGYILGHEWGGHRLAVAGALLATSAIFLPSFLLIALLGRFWPMVRNSSAARGALDGMNAAVVALILVVCVRLAGQSIRAEGPAVIAILSLVILLATKINSTWIIAAAALAGALLPEALFR